MMPQGLVMWFCCTSQGMGFDDAPVTAQREVAAVLEEHVLAADLPAVHAHHVLVGVRAVRQAVPDRVVTHLAQHVHTPLMTSPSSAYHDAHK